MKKTYLLIILLCLPFSILFSQKNTVAYELRMENFYHPLTADRVYNVICSALSECGNLTIRHNHEWKNGGKRPTDIIVLENEIKAILTDFFLLEKPRNPADLKKVADFSAKITTEVIVLPELVRLGFDIDKDYVLTLHILDIKTLQYIYKKGPKPVYLSQTEIDDTDLLSKKLCEWLSADETTGSVETHLKDDNMDLASLRRWIRMLILADRLFSPPSEGSSSEIEALRSTHKGELLYLNEKAVVISREIEFQMGLDFPEREKAVQLFEEEIDTLQQLHALLKSQEDKKAVSEKIRDYSFQLKKIKNVKT